ncbi:MAG: hypothetical protein FJ138_10505 [Deltaproteobacteria bacterium]|nr:hypothetical protein [Deltaproteobacteria bacterium]
MHRDAPSPLARRARAFSLALGALLAPLAAPQARAQELTLTLDKDGEPSVQSVQQVSMRYASLNPEVFQSMKSRSRVQAVLPQLTVRATKNLDEESRSLTRFGETNQPQDISATSVVNNDLQLYAEARWKLNEMVFNYQETAVMRENRYSAKERQKLLQTVTQVYFERKRALVKLKDARPGEARDLAALKVQQLDAELDSLTGGWFSGQINAKY